MCIACYCIYCRKVFVTQESNIPFLTLSCVNILVLHGYQSKVEEENFTKDLP